MDQRRTLLSQLTRALALAAPGAPLAARLCSAMVQLSGASGGAVTIGHPPAERTMVCATGVYAERLEEIQEVVGEGPGLDALRTRAMVSVPSGELQRRWPLLAEALEDQQPPSPAWVMAIPMHPDHDLLGVITLHCDFGTTTLDPDSGQFLADAIGIAILGRFDRAESTDVLWSTRDTINQATGMVIAQLKVSPADALAVLRAHAFADATSLQHVARAVVDRRLDFHPDKGDE